MKRSILIVLLFLISCSMLFGQKAEQTTIEDILSSPGNFVSNAVEITGIVEQYVKATSKTTSYYLLKGEYGGIIKVNTFAGSPEINKKYKVVGIVYIDPVTRDPFISEQSKAPLEETPTTIIEKEKSDSTLTYLVALFALLVMALIALFIYKTRMEKSVVEGNAPVSVSPAGHPEPEAANASQTDAKTEIFRPDPKTMKFIQGKLIVANGEDQGKEYGLAAFPTAEGAIVTIGREEVRGDRASAHIKIDSKYATVSHKQAEIIYRDGKVYLKNLSKTNPTQVDGIEIAPGEMKEIAPGALIRMGELEFKYEK